MTSALTMRCWQVHQEHLRWVRLEIPEPPPQHHLVRVAYAGVCGSDVAKLATAAFTPPDAWVPGHEISGFLAEDTPDQPIVVNSLIGCEQCASCEVGALHVCPNLRRIGADLPGGFAEYVIAPHTAITRLPADLPLARAVLVDAMAVAIHGMRCVLAARPPGRLGIIGASQIAVCTAAYATAIGWSTTIITRDRSRAENVSRRLPCQVTTSSGDSERDFDVIVDAASGHNDTPLVTALGAVADGGHVVVQNAYHPGVRLGADLRDIFKRSITISGAFSYCHAAGVDDFALAIQHLRGDLGWADQLVAARFHLSQLPHALELTKSGRRSRPSKIVLTTKDDQP